jgi:hypothetical protein
VAGGVGAPSRLITSISVPTEKESTPMTIIVKNSRGWVVHLRIDRRIVVPLVTLGLAMLYKGLPL